MKTKIINCLVLIFACWGLCGCITNNTINRAKGYPEDNGHGTKVATENPSPGYYWLVPLTVSADVATSPFQLIFIGLVHLMDFHG